MENNHQDLKRGLLPRHVQFMALAGMIGTGIFKGSSDTITIAGPSVVFAYLIGGLILFIIMAALGEMSMVFPHFNVQNLVKKAFGFQVSFVVGWLYWINWVLVTIVELLAAGNFLQYWFPSSPLWLLSLICAIFIVGINLFQVKYYGELEFWFAGIKIFALIAFILIGFLLLFGILPGSKTIGLVNYTAHGGFFPHGLSGMFNAFLVVIFSYGGAELIGLAVTETKDAERVLPQIIKGTVWRVIIFYICPLLVICGLIPWDEVSGQGSPFVQVFTSIGLPGAAGFMNFVLLTAVLSAANSGIYATSRTLYSIAQTGGASKKFLKTSKNGIPLYGIFVTSLCISVGVFLAYLTPAQVISYLMTIPGFTIMLIWLSICASQIKLRREYKNKSSFQLKGYPYTTILAIIILAIIFIGFVFNPGNIIGTAASLITLVLLIILSVLFKKM